MNLEDPTQVIMNNEVIIIAAKLLLAAVFRFQTEFSGCFGALRGLQDVTIPMYITFVAYWIVGFPISYYLRIYTKSNWSLDRIVGRINSCSNFFVYSFSICHQKK
jgi:MATE family multidrug resistance protein